LIAATGMGGTFGLAGVAPETSPTDGGVAGLAKCLAIEWPDVRVRVVDLNPVEPFDRLASHLVDELWAMESAVEIGYVAGRRIAVDVMQSPSALDPSFVLPSEAVVLATGGARGITAQIC